MIFRARGILFLFFLSQLFSLKVYGNINYVEKVKKNKVLEKDYFPTTAIKGNLFFTLGALSESSSSELLHFTYENKIRFNTTFNGNDNLLTIIESGNATDSPLNLDLQSKKGDQLKISTLLYRFKLDNDFDAIIGPKMFGYHGLAGKSTAYNERIAILDGSNFTTSSGIGPGIGISKRIKNGFNTSFKIGSNNTQIDNESLHFISQIGMTKKNFGGTFTSNFNDEFNAYGLATFYSPKNLPSISASIEFKNGESIDEVKNWVVAFQKSFENKKFGMAIGTHDEDEKIGYESWGEISISDKFKIIPVFFVRENSNPNSELGFSINTKFSY